MNSPIIILTDFGITDPFVGIMKGVIAQISPQSQIIDLTHEIPPGDIRRGAITLWQSVDYFPTGSTFLVVIDPGVGTSRRAILLHNGKHTFIAPDNGVLSFVLGDQPQAWEITNPLLTLPNPGNTFHGRDIFAPAAAHASTGISSSEFGESILDLEHLPIPRLECPSPGIIHGQILHADRFGNLLTSLGKYNYQEGQIRFNPWIGEINSFTFKSENVRLELGSGQTLSLVNTFADIPPEQCAVILGSSGLLEIVANRQSAANLLNLLPNEPITLRFKPKTI